VSAGILPSRCTAGFQPAKCYKLDELCRQDAGRSGG
jgi:hypothetical protein